MGRNSIKSIANELDIKLNEIKLAIQHPSERNKVFVLLEGKTDIKLFKKIFNRKETYITSLEGKEKIIKALEILNNDFDNVIGIKDADFDNLEKRNYENINLFMTDYADIEIHMIESPALDDILHEFGIEECYEYFLGNIRKLLYENAIIIGYLRWFNEKCNNCAIEFRRLNFGVFIIRTECKLDIDIDKLLEEVINYSNCELSIDGVKAEIEKLKNLSQDHLQICRGHDVTKLLAFLVLKNFNSREIERALRLSYKLDYFKKTKLFENLTNWAKENGFRLFDE